MKSPSTLKDLKAAEYNPREISPKQLTQLEGSVGKFGDLSGITFNVRSGVLVTGHQRVRVTKGLTNKIVRETKHKRDNLGTIATGHVLLKSKKGNVIKVPYREVDWDDNTEMAANIAANAAGGNFEMAKLGKLLKKLEKGKFPIEDLPLDSYEIKKSISQFEASKNKNAAGKSSESFEKVDPKTMKFEHQCPKCSYKW